MAWGCVAASAVGNLVFIESTMKKEDYLSILRQNVTPSVEKLGLGGNWTFQHDNDPKHSSQNCKGMVALSNAYSIWPSATIPRP